LTVPPKTSLTSLKSASSLRTPDKAPMRADLDVQRRLRRGVQAGPDDLADALDGVARARDRRRRARRRRERAREGRNAGAHRPDRARGDELGAAGLGHRLPGLVRVRDLGRHRREVEDHLREVDPRDPVDHRVVALGDEREAPVVEPLDEPELPQRL
jgi:hypothetical protein